VTGPDRDYELEDFLARRSTLHQRMADRDRVEPPPELDRLVLTKARQAIETPSALPVYRSPRWALPVALAATLVLTFAVVLNLSRLKRAELPTAAAMGTIAPASPAPPPAAALAKREETAPVVAQVETELATPPASALEMPRETRAGAAPERDLLASTATAISEGVEAKPDTTVADSAKEEVAAALADANTVTASATQGPSTANAYSRADARISPVAPMTAKRAMAAGAAAEPAASSAEAQAERSKHPEPQAWLREIERLRVAGKTAEADREMAAFRVAYPSHSAPEVPQPPVK
jgi:hypothetical protein